MTDTPASNLSERILRRIFGDRYEANRNEDPEMAVAHVIQQRDSLVQQRDSLVQQRDSLLQQRDSLAHALRHQNNTTHKAGLNYVTIGAIFKDVSTNTISFSRGVELLRSLARVAAEKMAQKMAKQTSALIRARVPRPRALPIRGSGALHSEQQYCYETGYREGVAALRKAQCDMLTRKKP